MNFYEYQARLTNARKPGMEATDETVPIIKIEELEPAQTSPIEVEEHAPSDTFIGRLREDIRKMWGGSKL